MKLNKKHKWLLTLALLFFIAIGIYLSIYKSFRYNSNNEFIGFLIIGAGISIIYFVWFDILPNSKWNRLVNGIPLFALNLGAVLGMFELKDAYVQNQINQFRVLTDGQVIRFEIVKGYRGGISHYATFKYIAKDKEFVIKTID